MNDSNYTHDCWPELAKALDELKTTLVLKASDHPAEYAAIPGSTDWKHVHFDMEPSGGLGRIFEPWKTLPNPNGFDAYIESLNKSVSEAMTSKTDHASGSEMSLSQASDMASTLESQDVVIPSRMAEIERSILGWRGETVDAFRRNYVNKFPYTLFLHVNIAHLLALGLEAIRDAHGAARISVAEILEQTKLQLESLNCWGGAAEQERVKSVITAALSVLGLLGGPVGAIVGAVSKTNSTATSVAATVTLFTDQRNAVQSTIGGSTIDEVWASMVEALKELAADIDAVETDVMNVMNALLEALDDPVTIQKTLYPLHELLRPPAPGTTTPETITETVIPPDSSYERPKYEFEGR